MLKCFLDIMLAKRLSILMWIWKKGIINQITKDMVIIKIPKSNAKKENFVISPYFNDSLWFVLFSKKYQIKKN